MSTQTTSQERHTTGLRRSTAGWCRWRSTRRRHRTGDCRDDPRQNGDFSFDLSPFDLVPGQQIWLAIWDAADGTASGNVTYRQVYNGSPQLWAAIDHRWIRGYNFPPDTELEVSLHAGAVAKGTAAVTTDSWGNFFKEWEGIGDGPIPGDTVTATYTAFGGGTVEMLVQISRLRSTSRATMFPGRPSMPSPARSSGKADEKVIVRITRILAARTSRTPGPRCDRAPCVNFGVGQQQPLGHRAR